MMTRQQYLTLILGEECSEVAQMTSKINRFGLHEIFPDQPLTNAQRLHLELDDLTAMVEMLNEECGLDYTPNRERIEAKKHKVNKYAVYSKHLGMLENSDD
jgi:hypothetical protein